MITIEEYKELKAKVDRLQERAAKAEAVHEMSLRRLEELGYDSVEDAEAGLKKLTEKQKRAAAEYESELKRFKERWGGVLEDVE
jgi:hypothetical protein